MSPSFFKLNIQHLKLNIFKLNFYIKATSFFRIPLLFFCCPKVLSLSPTAKVKLPLRWMSKNHYRSMYFGALCIGAELSVALPLLNELFINKRKFNFIFKDFKAEFLKRAEDHVIFEFEDVNDILDLLTECELAKTRRHRSFKGKAYSEKSPDLVFMTFEITISVKPLGPS